MPNRAISDVTKGPGNVIISLPGCVTDPLQAVMSSLDEEVTSLPDAGHEATSGADQEVPPHSQPAVTSPADQPPLRGCYRGQFGPMAPIYHIGDP